MISNTTKRQIQQARDLDGNDKAPALVFVDGIRYPLVSREGIMATQEAIESVIKNGESFVALRDQYDELYTVRADLVRGVRDTYKLCAAMDAEALEKAEAEAELEASGEAESVDGTF